MGLKWSVIGYTFGEHIGNQGKMTKILPPTKLRISSPPLHKWYLVHFFLLEKEDQKEHESIPFLPKYGQQDSKMKQNIKTL
jgi:hypothetical protein